MCSYIENDIELESEAYSDWCTECGRAREYVTSKSVEKAVDNILDMLLKEKILNI